MNAQTFPLVARLRRTHGRRTFPRVHLHVPARVLLLAGPRDCLLDDLSQAGARLILTGLIPGPGAGVVLTSNGLDAFGTVVWTQESLVGIAFEESLPLQHVVKMRHFAEDFSAHKVRAERRHAREFVQGPHAWKQGS